MFKSLQNHRMWSRLPGKPARSHYLPWAGGAGLLEVLTNVNHCIGRTYTLKLPYTQDQCVCVGRGDWLPPPALISPKTSRLGSLRNTWELPGRRGQHISTPWRQKHLCLGPLHTSPYLGPLKPPLADVQELTSSTLKPATQGNQNP